MPLSNEQIFALWAPSQSEWSVWAKPVLFADVLDLSDSGDPPEIPQIKNFPRPSDTAAVIDVEGENAVLFGLALAQAGYRPVPLFNSSIEAGMLVNMRAIANGLGYGPMILNRCAIGEKAPPAFMLNADRLNNSKDAKTPGRYDNRWCVVPQDMPSADYLKDAGIKQVALVSDQMMDDLSHILCSYQDAGIAILRTPDFGIAPVPETVKRPPFYKSVLYRFEVYAGLHRNAAGGFGGIVPDPNSGGGFAG